MRSRPAPRPSSSRSAAPSRTDRTWRSASTMSGSRSWPARIATELGDTLVAPVLAYVPEGNISPPTEHMRFPGTISIPEPAFKSTLVAAARSLRQAGFTHIVLLGDHGGYQHLLKEVAAELNRDWAGTPVRAHFIDDYYRATETAYVQALRAKGLSAAQIGEHAGTADTSLADGGRSGHGAGRSARGSADARPPAPRAIRGRRPRHSASLASTSSSRRLSPPSARRGRRSTNSHETQSRSLCSCLDDLGKRRRLVGDGADRLGRRGHHGRARHAGRGRSHQPLQRDPGRQAQPRRQGRAAAGLCAQPALELGVGDRSRDVAGRRHLQGRPQSAARRAVVGPQDAVGRQQCRRPHRRQPDADRSPDRQAGRGDRGRRSLQRLLVARRQVRDHRGRGAEAARLPRSADDEDASSRSRRGAAAASTTPTSRSTAASRSSPASSTAPSPRSTWSIASCSAP